MTLREGNLEAPTRHPIDWQSADFYDEGKALAEMERVFDICHGCRRCVSLCQSFPTLFDLIDATADGEVHGSTRRTTAKVVDQCYLCDLCYMTKCPYVPPHPWNVDFPHLMLRAKAIKLRQGRGRRGREAARLDRRARPARRHPDRRRRRSTPRTGPSRCARCSTRRSACIPTRGCRALATQRFRWRGDEEGDAPTGRRRRAQPGQGRALLDLLRQLQRARHRPRPARGARAQRDPLRARREGELLRHAQARARRPRGRGEAARTQNIPVLARYAREGFAILTRDPVVHADVQAGAAADVPRRRRRARRCRRRCSIRSSTSIARHRDGLLKTDFKRAARQGELPRAVPRPGAEDRPQDRGDAQADRQDGDGRAQHRRALLGPRRHLRREDARPIRWR